jgi:acyl-CoA-binding protein
MGDKYSELEQEFVNSVECINACDKKFDDNIKLKLYGYYKQGLYGDCDIPEPPFWQMKDKAKWDAWNSHKGVKKNHAMKKYIKLVNELLSE